MTTVPVPKAIETFATRIVDEIAVDATARIDHVTGHRWRVTVETARVRMWVEWEVHSRGRLTWGQSELFVDGKQVKRAHNYAHLLGLFADPDGTNPPPDPEPATVDPDTAPPKVRACFHKMRTALKKLDGTPEVIRRGRHWTVRVTGARFTLGFEFVTLPMNPKRPLDPADTVPAKRNPISLVLDGVDRTAEIQGRVDRALAMLGTHEAAPAPPPIKGPSGVQTTATSVTVRNQKVIRT